MLEIIKNTVLTNNKKEIDITKNGKYFMAPRVQSPNVQSSRVQWSSRPESKCLETRAQEFRVQASKRYVQSSACPEGFFKHCH